ncbi:MAG: class SAM-dependent methyltransferase [Daejeonella sp.]|nr:class SAM-dependent methyltransferase [Daejeonella sp.]
MSGLTVCNVCQSHFTRDYVIREMMFGTRDEFKYYECSNCGCLQITSVPEEIEKYYPPYYYSFNSKQPVLKRKKTGILSILNNLLTKKKERKLRKTALNYLSPINVKPNSRILDVGCGKGELICRLFNMGFELVEGTDKFLPSEINYDFGVKVMKKDLLEIESHTYDLVMMHHVLEHMFNPVEELKQCYRILKSKSYLIVRVPIKAFAWEKYKENWVQLDAPRHLMIHTPKSMDILAEATGFVVQDVVYDSEAFQFLGSELYQRDIPLHHPKTHQSFVAKDIFTKKERRFFKEEAKRLNEERLGDQAIFFLYKG